MRVDVSRFCPGKLRAAHHPLLPFPGHVAVVRSTMFAVAAGPVGLREAHCVTGKQACIGVAPIAFGQAAAVRG